MKCGHAGLAAVCLALTVVARVSAAELPPPAYQLAASEVGVPSVVLFSIALQESGILAHGRLVPWPWTLNVAGAPRRYRDRRSACAALLGAVRQVGANHVDAGLAQVNVGYHGARFAQPCDALEPYGNLRVAAIILREQHALGGNWLIAMGRYHRPAGGAPAARYQRDAGRHLARVLGQPFPPLASQASL